MCVSREFNGAGGVKREYYSLTSFSDHTYTHLTPPPHPPPKKKDKNEPDFKHDTEKQKHENIFLPSSIMEGVKFLGHS